MSSLSNKFLQKPQDFHRRNTTKHQTETHFYLLLNRFNEIKSMRGKYRCS